MPAASSARLMNGVVGIHKVEMKPKPKLLEPRFEIETSIRARCVYCGGVSRQFDPAFINIESVVTHFTNCEYNNALQANK